MKIILSFLLFISFNCNAATTTISKLEYVGNWEENFGYNFAGLMNSLRSSVVTSIKITPEFTVTFNRKFDDKNTQLYITKKTAITFLDDMIIIPFSNHKVLNFKLILSGWVSKSSKLIFGTLYIYNNGEVINGIQIAFKPSTNE